MAAKDLDASIAATRFGLGARPGEIAAARSDPRGWLKAQIARTGADQLQASLPDIRQSFAVFVAYRDAVQAAKGDPEARKQANQPIVEGARDEILARVQLATSTPAGFRERWTLFFANHFTVSAKEPQVAVAVGPFEREAIRPNVFGRFETLLTAATRHPGMLLYLDQAQSIGPGSPAGQKRKVGLNENLAREILELHTVGADAGYTQADVTEFARALTGWSMGAANAGPDAGAYLYRASMHEPGPRTVLGRRYDAGQDDQAARILADLAADPRTARRLARKIAAHFVSDTPPPALVARLEKAYIRSQGDLAVVAAALVDAPEAWAAPQSKLKTPYELIVSGYRAADAQPRMVVREIDQPLAALGQTPFRAPQPNGWSDLASDWAAPDAIVKRLAWAKGFAAAFAPQDPVAAADQALGARLSAPVRTAVARAETRDEAFALLLMSPEFQRR
jgi:uncharacterized protein (DUF1800 family)